MHSRLSNPAKKQKTETEQVSTEDIEEAMWQVKAAAAKARAKLVSKAKEHFKARNGFECNEEELNEIFNSLRDKMIDEDMAQSSSGSEDEGEEQLTQLQEDIASAFEHVSDLGQEAGKKMRNYFKELWAKETGGAQPTEDETAAMEYNLKHMIYGMVPVEMDTETDDESYEPSELEKESAEADEEETTEKESIKFSFQKQTKVSEEQFEKLVEKFVSEKGRSPTDEEADALLDCFSQKLTDAKIDDDGSDYQTEESEESEDDYSLRHIFLRGPISIVEGVSLEAEEMESEELSDDEQELTVDEKSNAFTYMKELEEADDEDESDESKEEEEEEEQEEEAKGVVAEEPSKAEQALSMKNMTFQQVCA